MAKPVDFYFDFSGDTFRCSAPEWGMEETHRNLIAFYKDEMKMISIGDRAEDMQARSPEIWQKIAERVAVVPIYDPNDFEPAYLNTVIQFYVDAFRRERYSFFLSDVWMMFRLRPNIRLQLNGYEKQAQDQKEILEYGLLRNDRLKIGKLFINENPIMNVSPSLDRALRRHKLQNNLAYTGMALFGVSGFILMLAVMGTIAVAIAVLAKPHLSNFNISGWWLAILSIGFIAVFGLIGARGGFLLGLLILSRFFPKAVLRSYLESTDGGFLRCQVVSRILAEGE